MLLPRSTAFHLRRVSPQHYASDIFALTLIKSKRHTTWMEIENHWRNSEMSNENFEVGHVWDEMK